MARKRTSKGPYVLTFQRTRTRKYARTLKQARADARYWLDFGQTKVCINKRLPSGGLHQVQCLRRGR